MDYASQGDYPSGLRELRKEVRRQDIDTGNFVGTVAEPERISWFLLIVTRALTKEEFDRKDWVQLAADGGSEPRKVHVQMAVAVKTLAHLWAGAEEFARPVVLNQSWFEDIWQGLETFLAVTVEEGEKVLLASSGKRLGC